MASNRTFTPEEEDTVNSSIDISLSLVALPPEIILHILRFLDTLSIFRTECVCKHLRPLAGEAYRESYGPGPLHRECDSVDFRALAIEQFQFVRRGDAEDCPPEKQTLMLLGEYYHCSDEKLYEVATDALLVLQSLPDHSTNAWNEGVATALMAQSRYTEAGEYYKRMGGGGHSLPERTFLTAARWSWPFTLPLPDATSRTLQKALIGAALHGDESMLMGLHSRGLPLDVVVDHDSPANAAARAGHIHILQLLRDAGIDLVEPPQRGDSPLYEAAGYGQVAAAQFLLQAGAMPDIPVGSSPAEIASCRGEVGILRLFMEHTATLRTAHTPSGTLRIEPAIRFGQIAVIQVFAEFFDINETDEAGQTAFHLAVDSENVELVEAVIALGGNMHMPDICGQTAFERAVSRNNPIVDWLSRRTGDSPIGLRERKVLLSKKILESQREDHLQTLAGCYGLEEGLVHSRWLAGGMEEKLSKIWVSSMSIAALDWYVEVILGSITGTFYHQVIKITNDILDSTDDIWIDEEDQEKGSLARDIATAVLPHLESRNIDRVARGIQRDVPAEGIRELGTHLFSPRGRMYIAGHRTKSIDQSVAIFTFISTINRR